MDTLDALRSHQLTGQTELKLSCGLTEFPREIFELADSLEFLNLSDNQLTTLPEDFSRLRKLRIVFFNNNEFEMFPAVLAQCPNLSMVSFKGNQLTAIADSALAPTIRWLILTNNRLEAIPASIGRLEQLQKLMLAGNRLRSLPAELSHCRNLELVRCSANQLESFPSCLLSLPRLSWLAVAGNPFCSTMAPSGSPLALPTLDWRHIKLGAILGQGASGIIYKATLTAPILAESGAIVSSYPVAIKMFKGNVTSDGLPLDEMTACMAAGQQPNLVTSIAKVINAPDQQAGLVLPLVSQDYRPLGGPPSLETCTRDTYATDQSFTLAQILKISRSVVAAIAHLHRRHILHGDLYAHNILVNGEGHAMLGDFGAASFYTDEPGDRQRILEALETRAFGCLLEDLLERWSCAAVSSTEADVFKKLQRLKHDCLQPMATLRPPFEQIDTLLANL